MTLNPIFSQVKQIQSQFSALANRLASLPDEFKEFVAADLADLEHSIQTLPVGSDNLQVHTHGANDLFQVDSTQPYVNVMALEAERDRLKALVESMTDEVWYCDTQGNVKMMNDRIVQNLGLDSVDDLNLHIHHIVTEKLEIYRPDGTPRPEVEAPQIRSLRGETVHGQEIIRNLRTRELRHREYASAPIRLKSGEIIGAVGLARDVTELRRLESRQLEIDAQNEVQKRLLEHREMERSELARNLHDGPIQSLSSLGFSIQAIYDLVIESEVRDALRQVSDEVKGLIAELRNVCNELRPPVLTRFGLARALHEHAEEFQKKYPHLKIRVECGQEDQPVPDRVALALFRIYQEGLNNVIRHSEATEVLVQLDFSPKHVIFELKDNGKGLPELLDWVELTRQGHFGMVGMKERAEAVGGVFKVATELNKGTTIQIILSIAVLDG